MLPRRFWSSLAAALLFVLAPLDAAPVQPSLERYLPPRVELVYRTLARSFSPGRAMSVVEFMARSWRLPGNPSYEASQGLIARSLAEAGFSMPKSDATTQPSREAGSRPPGAQQWYEEFANRTPAWEPVSAAIVVRASGTGRVTQAGGGSAGDEVVSGTLLDMSRRNDAISLCINSFSTPAEGVSAPLVSVGNGNQASDYEKVDVRGKIVLGRADARRLFEQAVRQRGAAGVLSTSAADYTKPEETPDVLQWSAIPYDAALHAFAFKISRRQAGRLERDLAAGPVVLQVNVVTRFHARPNRTLVAEIPGRTRPGERVVLVAHVQEPGANDNASGCATLLEVARGLSGSIERGELPPPDRTITFLWGDEITASRRWLGADPSRASGVRYAFSLDMTGEDVTKTGGSFLIEKQPDPSAVWARPSDPHTEWGAGRVAAESLKGNLLNDVHLAVCERRAKDTGWVVKTNPYEGGSDHSVFLAAGVPALLDWHFTDRYYHTNLDTPDKTSPAEMANVGISVGTTAWLLASANAEDALAVANLVEQAALARLALEARQSKQLVAAAGGDPAVRSREEAVFAAWQKWYKEALESVLSLPATDAGDGLRARVDRAVERVSEARGS
jgi:aminopeptidase YwaD